MIPFSTGTELEYVGIVGSELELSLDRSVGFRRWTPLQKVRNKGDRRGLFRCLFDALVSSSNKWRQLMMHFSTGTGLECVGIVRPELELSLDRSVGSGHWNPLQKARNKGD